MKVVHGLSIWGNFVKFPHTVFAMPFALAMLVVAAQYAPVHPNQILLIILALVFGRTAAMAFNRIVDRNIDARNERTRSRELPAGKISLVSAYAFLALNTTAFLACTALLGRHCLILAPLVLVILFGYSYTKRFTSFSHLFLGLALALAPGGVWYALTGKLALLPVTLMLGVLLWVAGFDVLYSCQDFAFDKEQRLYSLPVALGVKRALLTARLLHVLAFCLFFLFGLQAALHTAYFAGLVIFGLVLASQHWLVSEQDLSKIDAAFFTRNGVASVLYFAAVLTDSWLN